MLTVNIICKHGHYCLYTPVGTAADVEGLAEEAEAAAGSGSGDPGSLISRSHVEADADTLAVGRYCGFLLRYHSACVWHGLTRLEVLEFE